MKSFLIAVTMPIWIPLIFIIGGIGFTILVILELPGVLSEPEWGDHN